MSRVNELMDLIAKLRPYTDGLTDGGSELQDLLEQAYDMGARHQHELDITIVKAMAPGDKGRR